MKTFLPFLAAPFFFVGFLLPSARAAFNPAIVAGDAQWVVFLDCNELRATALGKELVDLAQKQLALPTASVNIRLNVGKVLATVGTVTAYGANFVPDPEHMDGALVLQGAPELRKIAESLVIQGSIADPGEFVEEKGLPFEAYRLGGEVFVGFPAQPIVLVSKSKTQLVKAHDVFRGAAASLGQTPASPLVPLLTRAGRSYVVAASLVPGDLGAIPDGPQTRILQLVNSGSIAIGENGDKTAAHMELVAASNDMGTKLLKIVEGMTALLSLAETTDRQLAEFLKSTTVARRDRTVTLDLAYSSERLAGMVRTIAEGGRRPAPAARDGSPARNPPKLVGELTLEGPAGSGVEPAATLSRKFENVRLVTGATVMLNVRREGPGRDGGAIDVVEISPAAGGAPLRFEAENMRLSRYGVVGKSAASGRRTILLMASGGSATFEFPGADGDYTFEVRYFPEPEANTKLTVSVRDPAPVAESN